MNPLDRLTEVISRLMGKEPSDPDVLEAAVDVVMAIREPSLDMLLAGGEVKIIIDLDNTLSIGTVEAGEAWRAMIDALLTEGEG